MRESKASLAVITDRPRSEVGFRILLAWSEGWSGFALIGGHVEGNETWHEACLREIQEELELQTNQFRVTPMPIAKLNFASHSKSRLVPTEYHWQIFDASLQSLTTEPIKAPLFGSEMSPTSTVLSLPDYCYWADENEIANGQTTTGRKISEQVKIVLVAVLEADATTKVAQSKGDSMSVHWSDAASQGLDPALQEKVNRELSIVFPDSKVSVRQRFRGYQDRPAEKLIIAVRAGEHGSCIVKLGSRDLVSGDSQGWDYCMRRKSLTSRILLEPKGVELPDWNFDSTPLSGDQTRQPRYAVVYQDANQFVVEGTDRSSLHTLEHLLVQHVLEDDICSDSLHWLISRLFVELNRCLYEFSTIDPQVRQEKSKASTFFSRELRIDDARNRPSVAQIWEQKHFDLRRHALAFATANRMPDNVERPKYIDPVDFVMACIQQQTLPAMTVGPSHGDLHGRNVLAGVLRRRASDAAIVDFADMSPDNVIVWDFVKLESELKAALFPKLLQDHFDEAWEAFSNDQKVQPLASGSNDDELKNEIDSDDPPSVLGIKERKLQILLAVESRLDQACRSIASNAAAKAADCPALTNGLKEGPWTRALRILYRIRCEAAIYVGYANPGNEQSWLEEYRFTLAAYGVTAGKWAAGADRLSSLLIAGGVAAANSRAFNWLSATAPNQPKLDETVAGCQVLPWAYRQWKESKQASAIELLEQTHARYPANPDVQQQLALALNQTDSLNDTDRAMKLIKPLVPLAIACHDYETLSRLGAAYKKLADAKYRDKSYADTIKDSLPMKQAYASAYTAYAKAYELRQHYYPGINAASTALLCGKTKEAQSLAKAVRKTCSNLEIEGNEEAVWILATEGEASLLLGKTDNAIEFYSDSIKDFGDKNLGALASIYHQLCRLSWALGSAAVNPVIELFARHSLAADLNPGPFYGDSVLVNPNKILNQTISERFVKFRKTKPIWARQLTEETSVETIEGPIVAQAGDFLCRGIEGEYWPQKEDKLRSKYIPTGKVDPDGWQEFAPDPDAAPVYATPVLYPFQIQAQWGLLSGQACDYAVRAENDPSDVWIVKRQIFKASYQLETI